MSSATSKPSKPLDKITEGLDDILRNVKQIADFSTQRLKKEQKLVTSIDVFEVGNAFHRYMGELPAPGSVLTSKDRRVLHNMRTILMGVRVIITERLDETLRLFAAATVVPRARQINVEPRRVKKRVAEAQPAPPDVVDVEVVDPIRADVEEPSELIWAYKKRPTVAPQSITMDELQVAALSQTDFGLMNQIDAGFGAMEGLLEEFEGVPFSSEIPASAREQTRTELSAEVPMIQVQEATPSAQRPASDLCFLERLRLVDNVEVDPPRPQRKKKTVKEKTDHFRDEGGTILSRMRVNKITQKFENEIGFEDRKLQWVNRQVIDPYSSKVLLNLPVYEYGYWNLRWEDEDESPEEVNELILQEVKSVISRWSGLRDAALRGISSTQLTPHISARSVSAPTLSELHGQQSQVAILPPPEVSLPDVSAIQDSFGVPEAVGTPQLPVNVPSFQDGFEIPPAAGIIPEPAHVEPEPSSASVARRPKSRAAPVTPEVEAGTIPSETLDESQVVSVSLDSSSVGMDWDEAKPLLKKLSSIWVNNPTLRVRFSDLCSMQSTRSAAAWTFKILLGLWGIQAVEMTQDSPHPHDIYLNVGSQWSAVVTSGESSPSVDNSSHPI